MTTHASGEPKRVGAFPGDGLLHPVAWGALALLLLNDHWAKAAWPGFVTGKLSDVAGLVMFPLALQAAWEWLTGRVSSRRLLGAVVLVTLVGFTLVEATAFGDAAFRWTLGALQWPLAAGRAVAGGLAVPPVREVRHVADVEDLLALPALLIPLWAGWSRATGSRSVAG